MHTLHLTVGASAHDSPKTTFPLRDVEGAVPYQTVVIEPNRPQLWFPTANERTDPTGSVLSLAVLTLIDTISKIFAFIHHRMIRINNLIFLGV